VRNVFRVFVHLGALGLFTLGVLDSSFLFIPVGNDLLLLVLTARNHKAWPLYVLSAALGSTAGVFLLDLVTRRGGEAGLEKIASPKRIDSLKKKMETRSALLVATACIAPPPFPFTPVVAVASALQFPRVKLLGIAFIMRLVRFSIVAYLAIRFGRGIVRILDTAAFKTGVMAFAVLCLAGSGYSVWKWLRRRG
jgi:membrane protein YqaA with SNARE-associated domain